MTSASTRTRTMPWAIVSLVSLVLTTGVLGNAAPATAGELYNIVIANLTTADKYGRVDPLPRDISVWLTNVDSGVSTKLGVGDTNQWVTPGRPDGRYRLSVTSAGKYPTVWWPGTYSREAAGNIVLKKGVYNCAGQVSTTGCSSITWNWQVQSARSVVGRVLEPWQSAVPGVTVTATRNEDPFARYSATTDAGGYYAVAVPPGKYSFSVPNGNTTAALAQVNVSQEGQTVNITRASVPSAPRDVAASAGSRRLSVTWSAPTDNGGRAIEEYRATASPGGLSCTTTQTGCVIEGVTNNTTYTVSVTATNAVGTSGATTSNPVTPLDPVPSAPRDVRAVAGSRSAVVSWTPPVTGADGVSNYRVIAAPSGATCVTRELSCTVTGLANGTSYSFRVVAASSGGESASSDASAPVIPATVPSAPRDVRALAGDRSITTTWDAPEDNGGAPVTGYTATAMPGGRQCTASAEARQCKIENLTRRAYTVTVTATNRVGASVASSPSNEVTPLDAAPPAPTGIRAAAGDREVKISWSAPGLAADAITGYRVTSSPGGFTCTTKDLSCTVDGLINGQPYTFRVTAASSGGDSAPSESSVAVTPAGVPMAPRAVQADPGDKSLAVSWNAPLDDGGAPVSSYTATAWPGGRVCTAPDTGRRCVIGGLTNGEEYSVTVTATNRVGTSERSPGASPVMPNGALPTKVSASASVKLTKASASRGQVKVRWQTSGVTGTKIAWQPMGKGKRSSQRLTASQGMLTLSGSKGTRFLVSLSGTTETGDKASTQRVFRISK